MKIAAPSSYSSITADLCSQLPLYSHTLIYINVVYDDRPIGCDACMVISFCHEARAIPRDRSIPFMADTYSHDGLGHMFAALTTVYVE